MTVLKHFDNLGSARFITFSCYQRQKLLQSRDTILKVLNEIEAGRTRYGFSILGYVIMPSHVHLVLYPHQEMNLGSVIGNIKRKSGFRILADWKKNHPDKLQQVLDQSVRDQKYIFWQKRCYDHNCRTPETVREKINYCHNNPVRAGFVSNPDDWEWSSYRWYMGDRSGVIKIDECLL